jgi:hypothetical protein
MTGDSLAVNEDYKTRFLPWMERNVSKLDVLDRTRLEGERADLDAHQIPKRRHEDVSIPQGLLQVVIRQVFMTIVVQRDNADALVLQVIEVVRRHDIG